MHVVSAMQSESKYFLYLYVQYFLCYRIYQRYSVLFVAPLAMYYCVLLLPLSLVYESNNSRLTLYANSLHGAALEILWLAVRVTDLLKLNPQKFSPL